MSNTKQNLSASVHQRLLNKAHETGHVFNELLQYYAIERLLYRLSISEHREKFILKGALMFNAWGLANMRPTRDIDLLGYTQNTMDHMSKDFHDICRLDAEPDGLKFDIGHLKVERIKEDAEYEGIRIAMIAQLGRTRLPIQIDIGFADVVTPAPAIVEYPILLDFPAPNLYGYPPETVIAEKFQAMSVLGMANSRMKDFYDVWMLATNFEFDGRILQSALENTFQNRGTKLSDETHVVFSNDFAESKVEQWHTFARKIRNEERVEMQQVIKLMREFLVPILQASQQRIAFDKKWRGHWK
jgi:predicted nucleotidyltransferase component of viral defense system